MKAQILTKKTTYTVDYPQAIEAARMQFATLWSAEELGVEKDENDIRSNLNEAERHGLITVLKLFTQYELEIGDEFWSGKFKRMFPRPDMQRAANAFAYTEINSHAPFYSLVNETLSLATDEFYSAWKEDPDLVERMDFVEGYLSTEDPYKCLAAFSFLEGVVLFSSFAYIKSFNMGGYNMIPHVAAGVDISCKEEHQHSLFTAWTYQQLLAEETELGLVDEARREVMKEEARSIAEKVYEHESLIVDKIFEKDGIRTITKGEILHFIRNRIDLVLLRLGCDPMFEEEEGVVSGWFYDAISAYKYADFFAQTTLQYRRDWDKGQLVFDPTPDAPAESMAKFLL